MILTSERCLMTVRIYVELSVGPSSRSNATAIKVHQAVSNIYDGRTTLFTCLEATNTSQRASEVKDPSALERKQVVGTSFLRHGFTPQQGSFFVAFKLGIPINKAPFLWPSHLACWELTSGENQHSSLASLGQSVYFGREQSSLHFCREQTSLEQKSFGPLW